MSEQYNIPAEKARELYHEVRNRCLAGYSYKKAIVLVSAKYNLTPYYIRQAITLHKGSLANRSLGDAVSRMLGDPYDLSAALVSVETALNLVAEQHATIAQAHFTAANKGSQHKRSARLQEATRMEIET